MSARGLGLLGAVGVASLFWLLVGVVFGVLG
jgi:hypothetical protein